MYFDRRIGIVALLQGKRSGYGMCGVKERELATAKRVGRRGRAEGEADGCAR